MPGSKKHFDTFGNTVGTRRTQWICIVFMMLLL